MTGWHTRCAAGDLCLKPGGSNTAGPAHTCVECRINVHTICSVSWDDEKASFGEGHKCFKCAGAVPPPPPDATAATSTTTSPQQPQEQQEQEEEEQTEEQQQQQQQLPEQQELQQPAQRHSRFSTSDMDWTMPIDHQEYRRYISGVMGFFHERKKYPNNKIFTRTELLELTPEVIKRWLALLAYGKEEYVVGKDMPTLMRSSSLEQAKKGVSYFMPYNMPNWVNGQGNPTKHTSVATVINDVKKSECRRQGRASKAKRPLREIEFRKTNELLRKEDDWVHKYKYPAMTLWQYHLIGRVDDTAHFQVGDPRGHDMYDFALKTRVRWSKNVRDERVCPDQILLGASDDDFCIFIMLSIYLESFLEQYPCPKYLFSDLMDKKAPDNLKATYSRRLRKVVWSQEEFKGIENENDYNEKQGIGTHSSRKFPATYARNKGCTPEEVEIRGRWKKNGGRVVFRYIDVAQLYEDAKVAAALCVGGPVKYALKDGIQIGNEWLFTNVLPSIRKYFRNDTRLCCVLALPLLYACMNDNIMVPEGIRARVKVAYNSLGFDEHQPVTKIPLYVYRINDRLMIDPIGGEMGEVGAAAAGNGPRPNSMTNVENIMMVRFNRQDQEISQLKAQVQALFAEQNHKLDHKFRTINNNIRCFGGTIEGSLSIQLANNGRQLRRVGEALPAEGNQEFLSTLSPNPRSLRELWLEYKSGIGGRKPAEQFTTQEKNTSSRLKQLYYRRNVFWQCMGRLIRGGETVDTAIMKIRQCYGQQLSVTAIINKLIADRKNGGHPNLR
jgi:hypothetical protein